MWFNENDAYPAQWLRNLWPEATVNERSIAELGADDIVGERAHFFAGIGGWEHALQLAGWPASRPAWTGSCPCQPFSAAGKRMGTADSRHLWPELRRLIAERAPPTIFGEQVASRDARAWLAAVRTDVEALGYAFGAACLPAAGVGLDHKRYRLFWVADANGKGLDGRGQSGGLDEAPRWPQQAQHNTARALWGDEQWLRCSDGQTRRCNSNVLLLAHGVRARSRAIKAYGNAIVPQVAAAFVRAFMECE